MTIEELQEENKQLNKEMECDSAMVKVYYYTILSNETEMKEHNNKCEKNRLKIETN